MSPASSPQATTRRRLAVASVVLAAGVGGAFYCGSRRTAGRDILAVDPQQNVLLVTIDTLRGDALGADGGPARTPNIDAIAAAGVRFSFAHAQAVVTLPSHASILTGTYPFQHGYRENSGYRLKPGMPTLATILKGRGFATGAFVAAFPLDARFGLTPGFDVYDGRFDDLTGGGFTIVERPASAVVALATSWIDAQTGGRWLAWVHVYEPHAPYRPPAPYDREYADRPYFGEVAAADAALGPLFAAVRRSARPTLVVITGDHGEALGDHGESTHGLFAYESTLRIPLIVAEVAPLTGAPYANGRSATASDGGRSATLSGSQSTGEVSDDPARHIDILPTILDALQIDAPAALPGHSLRTRADRRASGSQPSYFEAMSPMLDYGWAPITGVLSGREKFIDSPSAEMYDLAVDPNERTNLSGREAARQQRLAARLGEFRAALPGAAAPEDSEAARRLRALGYVSGGATPKARYTEADDPKRLVDVDQKMHEAVAADEEGRTADAIALYRDVLARRPEMMAASRHLAFDYWRSGRTPAAIDTLRVAIERGATPGAEIQLGTYLVEVGRGQEALRLLEKAAQAEPTLDALNALGIAYGRAGRAKDALAAFDRGLKIDPENPMLHENIGAVHLDAGQLAAARDEFERAIRANPASAQGHAGLATVAFKSGDRDTALASWKRAVDLDPTNWDALYNLGVQLMRVGRMTEARPYLERFVRTAPASQYAKDIKAISAELAITR
ncbi:MAG TPA: sulfatase-like hydrolase/transferase [Vicinamibacterales bacterium]|nr:sulfatase-like hydrolase/transferase [Vicinamibacterales bacterium]